LTRKARIRQSSSLGGGNDAPLAQLAEQLTLNQKTQSRKSISNQGITDSGDVARSACAARRTKNAPETDEADPHLAKVIDAWPKLPEAVRTGILAMVEASKQA